MGRNPDVRCAFAAHSRADLAKLPHPIGCAFSGPLLVRSPSTMFYLDSNPSLHRLDWPLRAQQATSRSTRSDPSPTGAQVDEQALGDSVIFFSFISSSSYTYFINRTADCPNS